MEGSIQSKIDPFALFPSKTADDRANSYCYTSQLKYVFRLEVNVSRAVGQNSLTSLDEQNSLAPWETTIGTFDSHVIRSCSLKHSTSHIPKQMCQMFSSQAGRRGGGVSGLIKGVYLDNRAYNPSNIFVCAQLV